MKKLLLLCFLLPSIALSAPPKFITTQACTLKSISSSNKLSLRVNTTKATLKIIFPLNPIGVDEGVVFYGKGGIVLKENILWRKASNNMYYVLVKPGIYYSKPGETVVTKSGGRVYVVVKQQSTASTSLFYRKAQDYFGNIFLNTLTITDLNRISGRTYYNYTCKQQNGQ